MPYEFDNTAPCSLNLKLQDTLDYYDRPLIQRYLNEDTGNTMVSVLVDDDDPQKSLWLLIELGAESFTALVDEPVFEKAITLKSALHLAHAVYYCTSHYIDTVAEQAQYFKTSVENILQDHLPGDGSYLSTEHYVQWRKTAKPD